MLSSSTWSRRLRAFRFTKLYGIKAADMTETNGDDVVEACCHVPSVLSAVCAFHSVSCMYMRGTLQSPSGMLMSI
jgi:hypothetical protein